MMENTKISKLKFEEKLFLLGVLLKPFYILPSGSLQAGDMMIFLSFAYHYNFFKITKIGINREDRTLVKFVGLILLINGIYFSLYLSTTFVMSSFYYIFNFIVVVIFSQFMCEKEFLLALEKVLKVNLLIQLAIYVSGKGKWYWGHSRYMGTFNDPNQFGFFVFASFLLICLLSFMDGRNRETLIWLVFSIVLMFPCASTGMLLGFGVFTAFYIVFSLGLKKGAIIKWMVLLIAFFAVLLLSDSGIIKLPRFITESFMYERLIHKTETITESSGDFITDRNWNKVANYPERILFGAGEGYLQRFGNANEVHSTILGPLWYYGIIPCGFWFSWCYHKMKDIKKEIWCVYVSLILESITLVHNRQPFFWMIFVLAGHQLNKNHMINSEFELDQDNQTVIEEK